MSQFNVTELITLSSDSEGEEDDLGGGVGGTEGESDKGWRPLFPGQDVNGTADDDKPISSAGYKNQVITNGHAKTQSLREKCRNCKKILAEKKEVENALRHSQEKYLEQEELLNKSLEETLTWKNKFEVAEDHAGNLEVENGNLNLALKESHKKILAMQEKFGGVTHDVQKLCVSLTNMIHRSRDEEHGDASSHESSSHQGSLEMAELGERVKLIWNLVKQKIAACNQAELRLRAELARAKETIAKVQQHFIMANQSQPKTQPPRRKSVDSFEEMYEEAHQKLIQNKAPHSNLETREQHAKDHCRPDGYFCLCGKKYGKDTYLADHILTMTVGKQFQCRICNRRFLRHGKLRLHMLHKHHILQMRKYGCKNCGETFSSMPNLFRHRFYKHNYQGNFYKKTLRLEANKLRLTNGVCPSQNVNNGVALPALPCPDTPSGRSRSLSRKRSKPLRYNEGYENENASWISDEDDPSLSGFDSPPPTKVQRQAVDCFNTPVITNVKGVVNTGSVDGDQPCSSRTVIKANGIITSPQHGEGYSDQGGFSCLCGTPFTTKANLRQHILLKDGDKTFVCQQCPQKFGRHDYLKSHMKSAHRDVLYTAGKWSCRLCGNTFASMKLLHRHRAVAHTLPAATPEAQVKTPGKFNIKIKPASTVAAESLKMINGISSSIPGINDNGKKDVFQPGFNSWLANLPSSSVGKRRTSEVFRGGIILNQTM